MNSRIAGLLPVNLLFMVGFAVAETRTLSLEDVVVFAHPLSGEGLSQASDVLDGAELQRHLAANLGDTLARLPGVHSAPFGNAVGRPIIHGLSGPRVRIMEDRIDTLDVSVTSADHAVGVEPFVAQRIEVLKGASTLLYGAGAIGGVVDVHTGRIPHTSPEGGLRGGIETRYNDNTNGNTSVVKLDAGGDSLVWHIDASRKRGDDYEIPSFTLSQPLRLASATGGAKGVLPGSGFESDSAAIGASYLSDAGLVGISVSTIDAAYGLPGDHGDGLTPNLELEQTRVDFEWGQKDVLGRFESFNLRIGVNDYEHQEIEPDGEIATKFANKAWEARAELVYDADDWRSVFGLQHSNREFSAVGEEAFIAPVDTRESGVFWLSERTYRLFDLEAGLRLGELHHKPLVALAKGFSSYAASLGAVIPLPKELSLGVNLDYSSRPPVAEELYSNGPHLVTNTFELGSINLSNESAINAALTLEYNGPSSSLTTTVYNIDFNDFIYQTDTGQVIDGLTAVAYQQADARFYGIDIEVATDLYERRGTLIRLNTQFDFVHAQLKTGLNRNLPRTPPRRIGVGLEGQWRQASASIDYLRVSAQNTIADGELRSEGYSDLAAYFEYRFEKTGGVQPELFLKANNLGDQEQRIHTSFIKSFAPTPGRAVELGVRMAF